MSTVGAPSEVPDTEPSPSTTGEPQPNIEISAPVIERTRSPLSLPWLPRAPTRVHRSGRALVRFSKGLFIR